MKFTLQTALEKISKSKNITVDSYGYKGIIKIDQGNGEKSGLKILSAVDFLVNHNGYNISFIKTA